MPAPLRRVTRKINCVLNDPKGSTDVKNEHRVRAFSLLLSVFALAQWAAPVVQAQSAGLSLVGSWWLPGVTEPMGAPTAPGTSDTSNSSITWTWTDNSTDETGFKVWADPGAGTPVTLQIITAANATAWRQQGLAANTLYSFQAAATVIYEDSARTSPFSAWTQADTPASPAVSNPKKTTLDLSIGENDGNPAITEYAVECTTTGQWLTTGGTLVAAPEYNTHAAWGTVTLTDLTPATTYSFVTVARNGAGLVTAAGPTTKGATLTSVPNVVAMTRLQAQSAISGAKLVTGTITEVYNNAVQSGDVISQDPAAGLDAAPGAAVNLVVSLGPAPVAVPNLAGLTRTQAQSAVTAAQLTVGAVGEEYSSTVAAGSVTFQLPAAGTQVAGGSAVNFMISRGPAPIEVPTVTGLSSAQAQSSITAAGLLVGTLTGEYSSTVQSGTVMAQIPAAGWLVSAGTPVNLTVSKGPAANVSVPNVVGLTRVQADAAITAVYLAVGAVADAYSATLPVGSVLSQYPAPGTQAAVGSAVNLVVNRGAAPVPVPGVVGLTRAQAGTNLAAATLALGSVTEEFSSTVTAGLVTTQNPATGVQVAPGTAVNIVVSKGASQATVPNVVGISRSAAEFALLDAELAVGTITLATSSAVAQGNVISQNPAAGTQVAPDTKVSLVVNRSTTGDGQVAVPQIVGLAREQAEAAVTGADLAVGAVTEEASETIEAGIVLRQTPVSGTIMASGAAIDIVVSTGADDSGCGCFQCNNSKSGLPGVQKALGDFFLMGLSLVTLLAISKKNL